MPNEEPLELEALASTLQARKQATPTTHIVQQPPAKLRINPLYLLKGQQLERIREVLEGSALELAARKETKISARSIFMRVMQQISMMENQAPSRLLRLELPRSCNELMELRNGQENDVKRRLFRLRKVETYHDLSCVGIDPPTGTEEPSGSLKDMDYEAFSGAFSSMEFKDMEDNGTAKDETKDEAIEEATDEAIEESRDEVIEEFMDCENF